MLIIQNSLKIECVSYDSLYGFIFKIGIPVDNRFFQYYDIKQKKTSLTHILLKVIIINDSPKSEFMEIDINTNKTRTIDPITTRDSEACANTLFITIADASGTDKTRIASITE